MESRNLQAKSAINLSAIKCTTQIMNNTFVIINSKGKKKWEYWVLKFCDKETLS